MARLKVKTAGKINTTLSVPGDKSISHRAVMLGALAQGETRIRGGLLSADCLATIDCFRKMGIEIQVLGDGEIIVKGKGLRGLSAPQERLYTGNSGTTLRLLLGILAGQNFTTHITGDKSIERRPMKRVILPLRAMGAEIRGIGARVVGGKGQGEEDVYPPLRVVGSKLRGIEYELPVASAQVKSAVLLAGLLAEGETAVVEKNPSRDHTERMLQCFRADTRAIEARVVGGGELRGCEIEVPGDISSAAFFMVAGLLVPQADLLLRNVGLNPTRTGIIDVLHRMGAKLEVLSERMVCEELRGEIRISNQGSRVRGVRIEGEIIPRIIDEIPIIALAATQAEGVTEIVGARELRVKESDRIKTICSTLTKLGARVTEVEDGMLIEGPTKLKGAVLSSYGDHRIAMLGAIAGLVAEGETVIEDTDCIETSFPGFDALLKQIIA
jgi:3-phosphoshikimate 1-carboxyvinyltransferase